MFRGGGQGLQYINTQKISYRDDVLDYAEERYGTTAEYLWTSAPGYAVLRHEDNKKWYAIIMNVKREKLGLSGSGYVDILDIKCEPMTVLSLLSEKGFLPAYHMHRGNWITVLLDGMVEKGRIFSLLDMSFDITAERKTLKKVRRFANLEWIVPANPKCFDLEKAFAESETILWKQSNNIIVGDTVYLYVAAPISAIRYKCKALEVDIPYQYNDGKVRMSRIMKLKLLHRFSDGELDFKKLNGYGIYAVRGPRSVPNRLHHELKRLCNEE